MSDFDLRKFLAEQKAAKVDKHDGYTETKRGKLESDTFNAMKKTTLKEEFKQQYVASAEEIKQYLEKKLSAKHDKHIVDEVYKKLFDGIEFLVDEQPGTGELEAAYSISENLEDKYYEEEQDEHLAVAQEITKLIEPFFMASENVEEADTMEESVLGGIAALVGGSVALGKLLDYLKSKGFELTDPNGKSVLDTTIRGLKKEGEAHEGEEMEEEVNEEEIKENTFKSSIKDILNS